MDKISLIIDAIDNEISDWEYCKNLVGTKYETYSLKECECAIGALELLKEDIEEIRDKS